MEIIDKFRLNGKKTFITGGARGIGKCIAACFVQAGADVALIDINLEDTKETVNELKKYGTKVITVKTDVTKPKQVNNMIKKILDNFGTIDVAVNNAGICVDGDAEEMSFESWKKVIDVNLTGVFLTSQAAGRIMIKNKKGSIINTGSISGHISNYPQGQCGYNASKAGVINLTKSLASEWAKYNVRVNSISPGYMATEMTLSGGDWIPIWENITPMKRIGNPEELQGIILSLASDASTYTTGADIIVDGGYTCW
jgi:NAD(P)-dependent dehydrogenase (short-subunit alcohol dehydrogenase family)